VAVPSPENAQVLDAERSSERREKRRVAERLQLNEGRFRLLVEGIQDYGVILMDSQGLISSWNHGAERLLGYATGEMLGQPFARLFLAEEVAAGRPEELLRRAAETGRTEDQGWRVRKDGSRCLVEGVITSVRDGDGILQGFSKVCRDITDQHATQAALRSRAESLEDRVQAQVQELLASEARLQGFIRHAPAGIAFKDAQGRFLVINPQMAAIIGKPAGSILGRTIEQLVPPGLGGHYRERDERVLRLGQSVQEEDSWVDAQGALHVFLSHVFPLVDDTGQGRGLGYIGTDITEHKLAELALLQRQKLESLGLMTGGIAHDCNNLLGAMLGNVELAKAEVAREQARVSLETLEGLIDKASGLLRQMLAYAGAASAEVQTIDLNQLVVEMTGLLGTAISKRATITLELHPQPLLLVANPSQLQQVVMNLVINASEALEDRPGTITLSTGGEDLDRELIALRFAGQAMEPGDYVFLRVADSGVGMTAEVLGRIFEPFFTTKFTGRGLGLAAIHGIVRSHRGALQVTSAPGQGSTFKLLFPAAEAAALAAPAPPAPPALPVPGSGLVLVVDDEAAMRSVAVRGLERAGFQVLQAGDGKEALDLFAAHRGQIQVILMDLTMPNMDGETAFRELRRGGAEVPVILCSGFDETDALRRFADLGLAGFLQKPFRLGPMVAMVQKVLPG
jgi:PAS domain S-box-containing protein